MRDSSGHISVIDAGSKNTEITGLNNAGQIIGNSLNSPFIGDTLGNLTFFDIPTSIATYPTAINATGQVAGYWKSQVGSHGFVRDTLGNITSFDASGASTFTVASSINSSGTVVGSGSDNGLFSFGFQRDASGTIIAFQDPLGRQGVGTFPLKINDNGLITGDCGDSSLIYHGFIAQLF